MYFSAISCSRREVSSSSSLFLLSCAYVLPCAMDGDLQAALSSAGVPERAIKAIEEFGFKSVTEFAMIGDSESKVDLELIGSDEMKALGLSLIEKVRIRRAWSICRQSATQSDAPSSKKSSGSDEEFPEGVEKRLSDLYLQRYGANPYGTRLMSTKLLVPV